MWHFVRFIFSKQPRWGLPTGSDLDRWPLGTRPRQPGPSLHFSLGLELLISGSYVFLFRRLLFILERGKEDMGGGFLCVFVLIVCAPFNLPSPTGILSFMSEMMQLKFRNIKQLGSCHFSIRASVPLFSYLFSLLSFKPP